MKKMLQTLTHWFMVNWLRLTKVAETQLPYDPLNKCSTRLLTNPVKGVTMIILFTLLLTQSAFSQTQTVILTSGSSWTVPSNVYSITVECWGGGGGGSNTTTAGRSGGGGGGGAYAKKNTITVTPGNSISYSIGGGGSGSSAGGDTWFNSTSTVLAKGGSGGANNGTSGGTGGSAAASVGDVKYDGGKGGNGTGTGCCDGAGGGGSGAGSTGNGNAGYNGSSNSGWCSSGNDVYGGDYVDEYGGAGGIGVGSDGSGGGAYNYGAGGGGAKKGCASPTNRNGGNGTQGLIRITYCYAPGGTNAGANVAICDGGNTTLSGSATAYSGTNQLLFQDFENTGWTITYTGTASARFIWTYGPVSTANGKGSSGSPTFIFANGDNSTTSSTTTITSPTFSTVGYTSLNLSFRHHYDDYDATDNAYVEVYNGSSWVTVQTYITVQGSLTSFAAASINLNSYVGISNFAIRFRYTNNDDWYWLIDDITISGNISPAVTYSWSPSTGLSATNIANPVASPSSTQTYTLTTSHNGCSVTTDDVIVTVLPAVSDAVANFTLAECTDPNNPYAVLSATAPTVGSGTWSIISGPGTFPGSVTTTTTNPVNITGLSTTGASTQVKWEVAYASAPTCPKSQTLTITPQTLNLGAVSLQSTGSPQYYNCRTCSVKDGNTYTYYDNVGKIIAKVVDPAGSGIEMGNTEVCSGYDYNANSVTPTSTNVKTVLTNYGDQQPYLPRYWSINPVTKTGQDVTVTLYFTQAEFNALQAKATGTAYQFSQFSDLVVTKFDNGSGGTFTAPPNYPATNSSAKLIFPTITRYPNLATGPDYAATFTVSSFSTFYIHPNRFPFAPLPVELVSFTGYNNKDQNVLNWVTASEKNVDKFEVEKSTNGLSDWSYIGWQKAVGGNVQKAYTFSDNQPVVGNNYYRLKIIDNDGTFTYSQTINIPISEALVNGFVKIFPNPTSGTVNLQLQSTKSSITTIEIANVLGQVVSTREATLSIGVIPVTLDISYLPNGTYFVSFMDALGTKHQEKIIKQ